MNVLVAGGTGFIGRRLSTALVARGDVVTVVSRDPAGARRDPLPGVSYRGWLPELDEYGAVVNLAGEPIFGPRWTPARMAAIHDSRTEATRRIVEAIVAARARPAVLVNASAVGYYGDRGAEVLSEDSAPGDDFMAGVCRDWEAQARRCPVRLAILRFGVVLGDRGGALEQMLPPFKLGIGGPIGLGRQCLSWIARDDLVALLLWAIDGTGGRAGDRNDGIARGEPLHEVFNATAPGTVTNATFSHALGHVLHRPAVFPIPPIALRLRFGPVAQVLTASQRCTSEELVRRGFVFGQPGIEGALHSVLGH
ncbi:MAG TPA: TIGR01777 family oxidoreductase [Planctomycetota bacterium]|nr:TIGR01777 family oxidoreductase [Planctomycetota bacterium]